MVNSMLHHHSSHTLGLSVKHSIPCTDLFCHQNSCREPAWGIPTVTRSWGRKPDKTQGHYQASGVPLGISWACSPKTKSAGLCTLLFPWSFYNPNLIYSFQMTSNHLIFARIPPATGSSLLTKVLNSLLPFSSTAFPSCIPLSLIPPTHFQQCVLARSWASDSQQWKKCLL